MDSDKQDDKSVWRWISTIPFSGVYAYAAAKYVVTAGSQGALDLTKYRGYQALQTVLCCGPIGLALSVSALWPGTRYVKIPVYVVYESGKGLVVEGYKSGKENAIYYGKLGYNSGGYIGEYLGPIAGFKIERYLLKKSTTDLMQGIEARDFREWREGVYADVGKYCGQIIGGGLGTAGGFVFGGIAGGVKAIPEGVRKGLEKACKDASNPGQKPTQSGDVM